MRGLLLRATVAAGAVLGLLIPAATASASSPPVLGWTPATSAGTYNYGTVPPGSVTPQTFTLKNSGGSASAALTVTVKGSAAFTKTADTCTGTSLGPGKSCTVKVTYSPTAPGQADQATLTATSPKPAAPTASLTLTGAAAKATPAINTSQQPASATVGSAVADQATVSGGSNPAGTVTFNLYNNSGCTGTLLFTDTESLANGSATSKGYTTTATGTDYWAATYNGNSSNNAVSSGCAAEPVTITAATPGVATSQQPASATVGSAVADKATVSGGSNPTGTVTFNLYDNSGCTGKPLFTDTEPLSGGTATSGGFTTLVAGTDYWAATYNGDADNTPVTSGCSDEPVTITPAAPAIATTQQPASATVGSAVADKATVSGGSNPTGTVTFNLYNNNDCTGTPLFTDTESLASGSATSKGYTTTTVGTDYWQAIYNGDANNTPVTSSCSGEPVTIAPAISTSPSAGGPVDGTTMTDTATLSGGTNPTGTITFNLYGPTPSGLAVCSGTPVNTQTVNVSGNGTYTTPARVVPAQAGHYWWTASYSGDASNPSAGTSCGEQVLITGDLTISPGDFSQVISPNENVYMFAFVTVAGGSQTQTFIVTNSGNTTLDPLDVREPSAPFSITTDNCMGAALAPGGTCTFTVMFTAPADCTFYSDFVDLSSDVTGETYLNLGLQAECD